MCGQSVRICTCCVRGVAVHMGRRVQHCARDIVEKVLVVEEEKGGKSDHKDGFVQFPLMSFLFPRGLQPRRFFPFQRTFPCRF